MGMSTAISTPPQLIKRAVSDGVTRIRLHLLLDGRDTRLDQHSNTFNKPK